MRLLSIFLSSVLALGAINSGLLLYQELDFRLLEGQLSSPNLSTHSLMKLSEEIGTVGHDRGILGRDPRSSRTLAKNLFRAGLVSGETREFQARLCEALRHVDQAIKDEPEDPNLLLAWLELSYKLNSYDLTCEEGAFTSAPLLVELSPSVPIADSGAQSKNELSRNILEYSAQLSPFDPKVQYQIGRLATLLGLEDIALSSFESLLRVSPSFPAAWARSLQEWIILSGEAEAVLPVQMSQVLFWSKRLLAAKTLPNEVRAVLEKKQRTAIEERWQEVQQEKFPVDLFFNELLELSEISASDEVRREVDATIVHIARNFLQSEKARPRELLSPESMEFLALRATLPATEGIHGLNGNDLRPEKGVLAQWGAQNSIYVDKKYQSIGMVIPERQRAKMITVKSNAPLTPEILFRFKLYTSDNNIAWEEVPMSSYKSSVVNLGEKSVVVFGITESLSARLWKLHYASKSDGQKVRGSLEQVLTIYGEG